MRVVVLGAGYAGLTLTRELEGTLDDEVDLVLVDDTGTHLVQHELHRLIRRPGLADELELPLGDLLDRTEVVGERVEGIDRSNRSVALANGETLAYDVAAICLGAATDFHGLPGLAEHATPLKRIDDARAIREAVTPILEDGGRIVVGGAGLSGVQVAGELAEMRAAADADAGIYLLERADAVAPGFDADFQAAVRAELAARDVAVWTDARVTGADADALDLADGESMAYDELIWTGGIRGDDAMDRERPTVRSDLRLDDHTFALGDAARVIDDHGERVPASARTAIGQARVAAANVAATVEHARDDSEGAFAPRLDRYAMGQPRWLVSVGDGAVAQIGRTVVTGRTALAIKTSVGAGYVGRVGPIRNAVDLVWSELGLADDDPTDEDDDDGESGDGKGVYGEGDDGEGEASEPYEALPDGVVEELTDE